MAIIRPEELVAIRSKYPDKKIAFCSGSFDLTHVGHVLFFEDCKKQAEILVVGVGNDELMKTYKGPSRPVLNEHVRLKMVDSLKPVDYVFLQPGTNPDKILVESLPYTFSNLKPDAYIINEDAFDIATRQNLAKQYNVPLIILPRTCPEEFDAISTTKIIEKIRQGK